MPISKKDITGIILFVILVTVLGMRSFRPKTPEVSISPIEARRPLSTLEAPVLPPFEPDTIGFYTMNDWFMGAKITVRNKDGVSVTGTMPMNQGYDAWRTSSELRLPSPGNLSQGYTVTVSSRHGNFVKFLTKATGNPRYDSQASIYLHIHGVCSSRLYWPEMFVNWAEVDVLPMGRIPSPRAPDDWEGC